LSIGLALAAVLFAGCGAVGPDYKPPEVTVPETWRETEKTVPFLVPRNTQIRAWWTVFDDPMLDRLIREAGQGN
jgi:outer membrane protein TolC